MHSSLNEWTRKTLDLAANKNYLDKLLKIYPAKLPPGRPLPNSKREKIIKLYKKKNYENLVIFLINLKNPFPIEHPYAALLRHLSKSTRETVIKHNPQIIKELANLLSSLGLDNIIKGVERPKDINRTLGAAFKAWVNKEFNKPPFKVVKDYNKLPKCPDNKICVYAGPDEKIASFIKTHLKLREPNEKFFDRDVLVKVKNLYVIGEARFLSTQGGSQARDLDNTLRFVEIMENIARNTSEVNIKGIALIDGIVWFYEPYIRQIQERATGNKVVMSALFLKEYLLYLFNNLT